jgi:nitrogen fixation protein NifX
MTEQRLSHKVALRIALATRALPDASISDMIGALQDAVGDQLDEAALSKITVTKLKTAFGQTYQVDGEEDGEDANTADIAAFKKAVRILWGETDDTDGLPKIEPYQEGDMPNSIRVAVASDNHEQLDGHFGSCQRYLIYQLSAHEIWLIDIRSALEADLHDDRNAARVGLIRDCHVVYVMAVGGPAAAKVIQANIYPMKKDHGGNAREILSELQQAIATAPPPWLAKILGVSVSDRVKNYKAVEVGSVND